MISVTLWDLTTLEISANIFFFIYTPGYPPMIPDDLSKPNLLAAINGATLAYFDGRFPETALLIAQEVIFPFPFPYLLSGTSHVRNSRCYMTTEAWKC